MWHRIMHTRLIQQRWSNRVDVIFTTLGLLSLYARRAQQSKTAEEKSVSAFFIVLFIRVFTHTLTFVLINLKHSSTPVIPRLVTVLPKRPGMSTERPSRKAEFGIFWAGQWTRLLCVSDRRRCSAYTEYFRAVGCAVSLRSVAVAVWWLNGHKMSLSVPHRETAPVSYTHLTLPTIYSV